MGLSNDDTPPKGLRRGRIPSGKHDWTMCGYHDDTLADHEERLRRIERIHWKQAGITGILSLLGGLIGALTTAYLTYKGLKP
jgi:hypothetical protein